MTLYQDTKWDRAGLTKEEQEDIGFALSQIDMMMAQQGLDKYEAYCDHYSGDEYIRDNVSERLVEILELDVETLAATFRNYTPID